MPSPIERKRSAPHGLVTLVFDGHRARTKYLVGDTFTAADLTFAALSAPVLLVTRDEGYGAALPSLEDFPEDTRALVTEVRGTRAGAFALEVFRKPRRARVGGG